MDLLHNNPKLDWYPVKEIGDQSDSVNCRKVYTYKYVTSRSIQIPVLSLLIIIYEDMVS